MTLNFEFVFCKFPSVKKSSRAILSGYDNSTSEREFLSGPSPVRFKVFVNEQKCNPDGEIDEKDAESIHISAVSDGNYYGTCRVFKGDGEYCKVGRLAVLKELRGTGMGKKLLLQAEQCAINDFGLWKVVLHAQKVKESWYANCGYVTDESAGEWLEEGMVHVKMVKQLMRSEIVETPDNVIIGQLPPFSNEIKDALSVRFKVFVHEQGAVPESEVDEWDKVGTHITLYVKDDAVAAVRVYPFSDGLWKLGRLCVLPEYRNHGLGKRLLKLAEDYVFKRALKLVLDSQEDKIGWYLKKGYQLDESIPRWLLKRYPGEGKPHRRLYLSK